MSVESFHLFADLLPEPMLLVRGDGTVLAANEGLQDRLDLSPRSVQGRQLTDLSTDPPDAVAQFLRAASRSRKMVLGALTLRKSDSENIACRCEGAVFRPRGETDPALVLIRLTPKGTAVSNFLALNQRVTELSREIARRKAVETALYEMSETLRAKEERLRLALEAGRMGAWDRDLLTEHVVWSPGSEAIHGLAPGTFGGTFEAFEQTIHPEDRDRVLRAVAETVERGKDHHVEYRMLWPDQSAHWIEARGQLFRDEAGRPVRLAGVCMDIEERKRTEDTLRFLADASAALAELVDYESTLQKVAKLAVPFFADWCGVDIAEPDGSLRRLAVAHVDPAKVNLAHELARRYPPDPSEEQGAYNVLRTGHSELMEDIPDDLLVRAVRDEEHLRIVRELGLRSYICVPIQTRGRILGVLSFVMAESGRSYDPADLRVAEDLGLRAAVAVENARLYRELREADRRKNEFLATLAHELRNPLAPVRNGLQILHLASGDPSAVENTRQMMERQLGHMVRLIDDLLDVSRITRGKIELRTERVDLASVVRTALEASRSAIEGAGHELTVRLPSEPTYLEADPTRLAQVVSNILNNAARYTPHGGRIGLTAGREGDWAVVRVRDNGLGIPAEMLPRVFEMFTQVNRSLERTQGGLGIGLALVRNLVAMHGGTVEAHSDGLGQGSEFVVRLPVAGDPHPRQTPASSAPPEPAAARRVLVVDDNVDAADSLALLLKMMRCEVWIAYDGPSGVELAHRHPPDVIFLDIGLPGASGYDIARQLRGIPELQRVRIVALTGWGQPEDRRRSREAGFDEHLVKPADADALRRVLDW